MSYRTVTLLGVGGQEATTAATENARSVARVTITEPAGARRRLMIALAEVVADKGYANTTIADIVSAARVSKRTFYEHFADKEACLLAVYEYAGEQLMVVLRAAASVTGLPWRGRVRLAASSYLAAIEAMPEVNRALLVEMQAAGPRAFALRRRTQQGFAELLRDLVEDGRTSQDVRPLSPALALAIVGGINELLLHAMEPFTDARGTPGGGAAVATPGGGAAVAAPGGGAAVAAPGGGADTGRITGLTDAVTDLVCAVLAYRDGSDQHGAGQDQHGAGQE